MFVMACGHCGKLGGCLVMVAVDAPAGQPVPAAAAAAHNGNGRGGGHQEDPDAALCPRCQRNKLGWNRKARRYFEVCFNCDTGRCGP